MADASLILVFCFFVFWKWAEHVQYFLFYLLLTAFIVNDNLGQEQLDILDDGYLSWENIDYNGDVEHFQCVASLGVFYCFGMLDGSVCCIPFLFCSGDFSHL